MKRRAANRTHSRRSRNLRFEPLESRVVLDGGIRAILSGGALRIQGDGQDNQILVEQLSARSFSISSRDGATLINGRSGPQTFTGVRKDINISLGAGNDTVEVQGTAALIDRLIIDAGAGNDDVLLANLQLSRLSVSTGNGSDRVLVGASGSGVQVKNEAAIFMGQGEDTAQITNSAFKRTLQLDLGASNDVATLLNVSVAKKSTVSGGAGADSTSRESNRGDLKYTGFESLQNSVGVLLSPADLDGAAGEPGEIGIAAIAVADTAVVVEDAIPNTALGNVLANDTAVSEQDQIVAVNGFAANVGQSVTGQYGFFIVHPNGTFTYILSNDNPAVNALNDGQTLTDSLTYTVSDGVTPSTGTLSITIQGNTDTGALTAIADAATVVEDAIPNTALGNVLTNDVGGVATKVVTAINGFVANVGAPITGQYGFFQVFANGTFTYILNNDNVAVNSLNAGQTLVDTLTYTVSDGSATSTGTLSITIQGNTDTGPLTAVPDAAVVVEDAIPNTALGNVLTNDTGGVATKVVSAINGFVANVGAPVTGQYGFFQVFANGTYTYILSNDNVAVNSLNSGETLTDTIAYTMTDGVSTSSSTLTITIQGRTDTGPLTAVADAAVVIEDAVPNTALGNVLTNDTGGVATKRVTAVKGFAANVAAPVNGQFGYFQIFADGTFTYILRNGKSQVNSLNNGQTLTDSINYTVSDGVTSSTGTLSITIQGHTD